MTGRDACDCGDAVHDEDRAAVGPAPADAAGLLAALAGLVLWAALTDSIYRYVRPTMRPWLVLSGVAIALLAVAVAIGAWRRGRGSDDRSGRRYSLVGWALLIPAVIALCSDPGALGSFAVGQVGAASFQADERFDLGAHVRSHSTAGQAPSLTMAQFLSAEADPEDRALLESTTVSVTGFVADDTSDPGRAASGSFVLARLMVGCCAGDAIPLLVEVRGLDGAPPPSDTWVEVTGRYAPQLDAGDDPPVLVADDLREVDEPREPYEYP